MKGGCCIERDVGEVFRGLWFFIEIIELRIIWTSDNLNYFPRSGGLQIIRGALYFEIQVDFHRSKALCLSDAVCDYSASSSILLLSHFVSAFLETVDLWEQIPKPLASLVPHSPHTFSNIQSLISIMIHHSPYLSLFLSLSLSHIFLLYRIAIDQSI